jgi:probable DNA repair protein
MRDALLQSLSQGGLLLTANRRLARRWRMDFDREQVARGLSVWESPSILPWSAWISSEIGARLHPPVQPSAFAEKRAWRKIVHDDASQPLLDLAATASTAASAWSICQQYDVPLSHPSFDAVEETSRFRGWAASFERMASARQWLPAARRERWLLERYPRQAREVWLDGFDEMTPAAQSLLQRMAWRPYASGAAAAKRVYRAAFPAIREELYAAAAWARERLEQGGARSAGIIVNNLAGIHSLVEQAFLDVLGAPLFNISLGKPSSQWPVIADALRFLRWVAEPLPIGEAGILLRSPFFAGGRKDYTQRARLDVQWREQNRLQVPFALAPPLLRTRASRIVAPKRTAPGAWSRLFPQALEAAGWPGDRVLSSGEVQAVAHWHSLLRELSSLDSIESPMTWSEAVQTLIALASESIFQPETDEMPVQILETLQASGLRFDAMWVAGLTDGAWPPPARPNPFLPLPLQRERQLPHASPARELAFARTITARLLRSADEIVFSHAWREGEEELRPSRLIPADASPLHAVSIAASRSAIDAQAFKANLETIASETGPPLEENARPRGGTRILAAQSQCPFSAFARYRLQAHDFPEPAPGLSPLERGTALHAALAALWRAYPSRAEMAAALAVPGNTVLRTAIDAGLAELDPVGRHRLIPLEGERMRAVMEAFLELDFSRADFDVAEVEKELDLQNAGLPLTARIDRIDRLPDGRRIVIDYKSGAAHYAVWNGERPSDVQLPIYAVALPERPSAIAFAQLKRGQHGFSGLGETTGLLPGVGTPERGWSAQLSDWSGVIERLWADFQSGKAAVDPKTDDPPCERCHLHGLCRIFDSGS